MTAELSLVTVPAARQRRGNSRRDEFSAIKKRALYEILQTFTLWARIELLIAQALGYLEGLS